MNKLTNGEIKKLTAALKRETARSKERLRLLAKLEVARQESTRMADEVYQAEALAMGGALSTRGARVTVSPKDCVGYDAE